MSDSLVALVHSLMGGSRFTPAHAADGMLQPNASIPFSEALQAFVVGGEGSTGAVTLIQAAAAEGQELAAQGEDLPVHRHEQSTAQAALLLAFNALPSLLQDRTQAGLAQGIARVTSHDLPISGATLMAARESPIANGAAMSHLWEAIASRTPFSPEPVAMEAVEGTSPTSLAMLPDAQAPVLESAPSFQGQQFGSVLSTTGSIATSPPTLPVPVHAPQWGESFSQRISWMAKEKVQIAALRLNPPELGAIDVRIAVDHADANITFGAQHAEVREAIEAALPRLREMLSDNGMNLVNVDVSQHSFSDQQRAQESDETSMTHLSDSDVSADSEQAGETPSLTGNGLIDRYV